MTVVYPVPFPVGTTIEKYYFQDGRFAYVLVDDIGAPLRWQIIRKVSSLKGGGVRLGDWL